MSQEYGTTEYWDNRYEMSGDDVFDWLFSYSNVKPFLDAVYAYRGSDCKDKEKFLLTGAGNAPFSPDMYADGYCNIVNVDNSTVVIDQMKQKHPEMEWKVMDALDMKELPDESFENVIDKSLIDTILCYPESIKCVSNLMCEAYRVLKPGGFLLSFSLHPWRAIEDHYTVDKLPWTVQHFNIPNARWNEEENVNRCVVHCMVLCIKPKGDKGEGSGGNEELVASAVEVPGALTQSEVEERTKHANGIIESRLFARVNAAFMLRCFSNALEKHEILNFVLSDEELDKV
mmetsp:Transcript_5184/g.8536  ORF Transcript_5184/g.8536 Transcript_5184/m.8536 type:complete len:287 (+) Transcript_5184:141-1001(+)|eukprot:CAMPEP_0114420568 /NCGR_PEP_ID=MMETSP0103-20121206/4625_1 /TAXON_ID=37642 ORGANISM="Paraphysomonas imperforata, Strain PA2" /NCGR_SAMPLE_ID=MMETSP0103 /ASSEMBLY_ACC=CAM_ASM_000201 /LENGTH=286 /DNA_ID=CAMNT_0001589053 /DNA_START=105 /DNA_END=965 /DNA_ORIENTATION=-